MYYVLVTPLESIDSRNTGIRSPNLFSAFLPKGISLCIEAPGQFFCPGASHFPENSRKKDRCPDAGMGRRGTGVTFEGGWDVYGERS